MTTQVKNKDVFIDYFIVDVYVKRDLSFGVRKAYVEELSSLDLFRC